MEPANDSSDIEITNIPTTDGRVGVFAIESEDLGGVSVYSEVDGTEFVFRRRVIRPIFLGHTDGSS